MFNPGQLEEAARKIADLIPQGAGQLPSEVNEHVKLILERLLENMDLVSREEFDIQVGVLAKTRAKLEALEKRVLELENRQ